MKLKYLIPFLGLLFIWNDIPLRGRDREPMEAHAALPIFLLSCASTFLAGMWLINL